MAEWLIRIIGKQRTDIDKDLLVQALIALGRQLAERQQAIRRSTEQDQVTVDTDEGTA